MKKILLTSLLACSLVLVGCATKSKAATPAPDPEPVAEELPLIRFDQSVAIIDQGQKDFSAITVKEAVIDMKTGWNLGNTLDATGGSTLRSETSWGMPQTTKEMIEGLANSGIKTIRIPVSWAKHMDRSTYTVNQEWMLRVKEIVDWAIDCDMYVIINTHHDNGFSPITLNQCTGYYPSSKHFEESERFLTNVWSQICLAFNNGYDEHLIFETMNEPRLAGTGHEWWFDGSAAECKDAADALNRLNQVVVDTIRASGGNNQKRFISVPGLQASPDSALNPAFVMPTDDEPGKLILSVHIYAPYPFAMQSPGETRYTVSHKANLAQYFKRLNVSFVQKGYPVIIGEYGATNKNNLEDRVAWVTDFITLSRQYGMTSCLWDNGIWELTSDDYNEHFGFYNRTEASWFFPEIHEAIINSCN